jgi:2-dehydro-3-deoxyphosphogluconate aldolase/(4S)-4-hydroxy-2-oxoglutarate aldolase
MSDKVLPVHLQERLDAVLKSCPLVPVIVIEKPEDAIPLGKALVSGGITTLEITLRTEHAYTAVKAMRKAFPEVWVGVGTVATVEQYQRAEEAGAQFVITPGSTLDLLEYGLIAQVPLLPGVSSLSELMEGYRLGYRAFKFFPAEVAGGVPALKAFGGPFPNVRFVPTGGIQQHTAANYLALSNVAAVGGSWLTPAELVKACDWLGITCIARESLKLLVR